MKKVHVNFYFLSTGFCGTRFHSHVLRLATNAEVWHQPGHEDIAAIVNLMEKRFKSNPENFLCTDITEFPRLLRRIDKRLALPWIYGDTLNWMRGLGCMLYKYVGPERLRLVELIRHPTATCRSILADLREGSRVVSSDIALAEETARRWIVQYSCIRHQFQAIDDSAVCKTVRLEDTSLEQLRELYEFLGLEGFDVPAITALTANRTRDIRHYHHTDSRVPASKAELQAIWSVCEPLAARYGYTEDPDCYYDNAPTRPVQRTTATTDHETGGPRPACVKLFDYRGLGLIVKCPSGIRYINQAGGPICFWLQAEGAFVPLEDAEPGLPGRRLLKYFSDRRGKDFMSCIRECDADFIDSVLAEHGLDFISVTRSRIGEAWDLLAWRTWDRAKLAEAPWEAWVPVKIRQLPYSRRRGVLSGCDATEAILIWENSN